MPDNINQSKNQKDPSQTDVASKKAMFEKVAASEKPPWAVKGKTSYKIRNKIAKIYSDNERKPQIVIPKAAGIVKEGSECIKSNSVAKFTSMFEEKNTEDNNKTSD